MDWYLDRFRYRTYIWCKDKWMVQLRLEQTFEVHQKYIRYILSARCWLTRKSRILAENLDHYYVWCAVKKALALSIDFFIQSSILGCGMLYCTVL
jgi:hypothetical protein